MNQSPNENLSVRIVTADYYLDKPIPEFGDQCYSAFRSLPVYHVPVVRIFGPNIKGVKTCVHVHGVFPYIFVPNWSNQLNGKDLYNFAVNLDKAINTSFARSNSKASHVHKITQVSGKPFYGYHEGERNFLKIEFYNPAMIKRAADLLLNAAVLNTVFQPHEAHIPYILQFFIDNNLYGMNNITFSSFRVRKNERLNDLNLDETVMHADSNVPKISYSKLEVDVTVSDLCNVFSSGENVPNNPGLAFIWEEEKKRRKHDERPSQITPNQSQERPDKPPTRTEQYFREKLLKKLQAIKDKENVMDIEYDEASTMNSTYEELNSQSRSLLEILENLAGQQKDETDTPRSASSSPSLVYSDDENNVADISAISSQPLLKFSAEADSILGNNFSDEENDLDEHDHKALSQTMTYTRHESISSDDSDSGAGPIPQLDGAHDTDTSNKYKNKNSTSRKSRQTRSSKEPIKALKENPSNSCSVRSYNLRSRGKNQLESKPKEKFQPKDFKIILKRLDTKISPKKIYPRLNIGTQKSPRSNSSKSFNDASDCKEKPSSLPENIDTVAPSRSNSTISFSDANDPSIIKEKPSNLPNINNDAVVPPLPESPSVSQSKSVNISNSGSKNDKRLYPQLGISIKKSPKSTKPEIFDQRPIRGSAGAQGLKKRKISFEEQESSKMSNIQDMNFVSNKWKKSLKRRKKDDTSFKIGDSFSLLEFRKSKSNRQQYENPEKYDVLTANEINSQGYSLRISGTTSSGVSGQEAKNDLNDEGSEMESLQILENDDPENAIISLSDCSTDIEKSKHQSQNSKIEDSDDDLLLAVPLDDIVGAEEPPVTLSLDPIVKIPRILPNYRDLLSSPPIYDSSLIELDILKSNGDTDSQIDLNIVQPLPDSSEDELKCEKSVQLATSQTMENSANSLQNATLSVVPIEPQAEIETKITKAPTRKRNLGIRIRKNMKMASQSTRNVSNSQEKVIAELSNCDPSSNSGKLETLPETYLDSSIDLDTTKYLKDSASQVSNTETSFQLRINNSYDSTVLKSCAENLTENAPKICTESIKTVDKTECMKDENLATSPSYNEDSCIELDIFKCASQDVEIEKISKKSKSMQEVQPKTAQPTCSGYEAKIVMPTSSEIHVSDTDCDFFDPSSQQLSPDCHQEELATSQCHSPNDQSTSKTPTRDDPVVTTQKHENQDQNDSCSNDSLLCALNALTPRTSAALNEKLDSALRKSPEPKSITKPSPLVSEEPNNFPIPVEDENSQADSAEPLSPSILDKTNYSICFDSQDISSDEDNSDKILFEDSPQPETEHLGRTKLESLLLNNSIWNSIDSDEFVEADNEIKSFYETCTPSHITIIRDTADEDSSPIAHPLTPRSTGGNEILSFYDSQSPDAIVCSISEELKAMSQESKSDPSIIECSQPKRPSRISKSRSPLLHSTPRSTKKSPSPTYTPILKKLMIKKVALDKRRVSSQRFHAEPFLPEIREEEEKKSEFDKNTTLSLPLECEKSIIAKSLNTSRSSFCSGASYQIDGATLENTCGFKMNLENLQDIKIDKQYQYITLISMELFAQTRGDLKPDPEYDAVTCVFYSIHHDAPEFPKLISGIIAVEGDKTFTWDINKFKCEKTIVKTEAELFDKFLAVIRKWDPDMFIGYEVEMLSWGFFIQRGHFLGRNYGQELARVIETKPTESSDKNTLEDDEYSNEIKLTGRIILNVWRLMRHEVNLQSYTFESILFHVQHQRVPYHTFKFLTECWKDPMKRWIVIDYFLLRAESNIAILEQLDFICRTSELARLFGIQFYEVLSRGSQFRVESMMLRLAKTQNYVAVSPSVKQRFNMRAPECLPLIMEPESKFYTDPVIVLDFQSLYPSIVIAYNYCFSTCLGRIDCLGQSEPFHFGCVEHVVPADLLIKLEPHLNLSPAGVAFVNRHIRKGILPSMLEEILETRLMVKKSMKENKNNSILKRVLHARQLGLKLIANVTYGYTSANFSGRMPCMEVADSVVSKGRETLERAIEMVNKTEKWGARVVYGDTDSLFVLVPNRTKEEAFRIGAEIADAVTNDNPKPVKLKLEKVYLPCILQTKKRYVGYMYESPDQEKPVYDAKGIETVRRDGCPAVSKILEKSLKLLFETRNITTVKQYAHRQFTKLISGRISIQELTFAREYRGMNNYKPAACVPALQLAKQALLKDRRSEPRIKERVPYVIITGPPGVPLIRLVRTPQEYLDIPGSLINTEYYITRAIVPALARCFILMNVNVMSWYTELPKKQRLGLPIDYEMLNKPFKKTTISHYFSSSKCLSCSKVAGSSVCKQCIHKPQRVALVLGNMINDWQRKHNNVAKICRSCCARTGPILCSSLDCPIYYLYRQTEREAGQVRYVEDLRREYLYF